MAGKGFCVKIQLDLYAVTCPGVWLCPNGDIALRINTLNSTVESHRIEPVFPLLFHDKFSLTKIFSRVVTLTELQRSLEQELFYAELVQWTKPLGKGIVLATFETNLEDLLYPAPCYRGLVAGVDVDLLMEPTKHFPGIIAPKIEVSTRTTVEEILGICDIGTSGVSVINPKTVRSKRAPCGRRKHPTKGIIRQRRVCHSRGKIQTENYDTNCQRQCMENPFTHCLCFSKQDTCPEVHRCYQKAKKKSDSAYGSPSDRISESSTICDNIHIFDDCPVCSKYKCYFSGHCDNSKGTTKNMNIRCNENLFDDVSPKHIQDSDKEPRCICRQINTLSSSQGKKYSVNDDYRLQSKIRDLESAIEDQDRTREDAQLDEISDYCCTNCQGRSRHGFYKNLEKFYKRMYKQAKMKARRIEA